MNTQSNPINQDKGKLLKDIFPSDYTVIDIETTGLSTSKNEIIELSALKIRDNKICDSYTTLVKPQTKINYFISNLTGITNEMTTKAPSVENILDKYLNFIGNDIVIGHNISFDIGFIHNYSLKCYDKGFSNDYIDTCRMSRKFTPLKHHKLNNVAEYYQIDSSGHHRADNDCRMTYAIYEAMKKEIEQKTTQEA